MMDRPEERIRTLAERKVDRLEILRIGAKLGLSLTALTAIRRYEVGVACR